MVLSANLDADYTRFQYVSLKEFKNFWDKMNILKQILFSVETFNLGLLQIPLTLVMPCYKFQWSLNQAILISHYSVTFRSYTST